MKWTEEEIEFLKENYADMTAAEIAKNIGRSEGAVAMQANFLELKKNKCTKKAAALKTGDWQEFVFRARRQCGLPRKGRKYNAGQI